MDESGRAERTELVVRFAMCFLPAQAWHLVLPLRKLLLKRGDVL